MCPVLQAIAFIKFAGILMIKNKIILSELFNMRKLVIYYGIFKN